MGKSKSLDKRLSKLESTTRPEVKWNYGDSGAFDNVNPVATPGIGTLIKPQRLANGTGRDARVGDKVKSRNIKFQAIFKMPSNPSNATCGIRILVLRSKKQNPSTGEMPNWYGHVDEDKFFIVKDSLTQVSINSNRGTSMTGSTLVKKKFNIPIGLRKMQYDGSSTQSPLNNEYFIYLVAENASAEMAYTWKHYFIDN